MSTLYYESSFAHHGVKGQKWGVRRYQNKNGSLTKQGLARIKGSHVKQKLVKEYLGQTVTKKDVDTSQSAPKKDLLFKKGSKVTHVTPLNFKQLRPGQDLFVSADEFDKNLYRVFLTTKMMSKGFKSKISEVEFELKKDLKAPSDPMQRSLYERVKSANPQIFDRDMKNRFNKDNYSYNDFVKALDKPSESKKKFMEELSKNGYNAILDSHDITDSWMQAKTPLIVMDAVDTFGSMKVSEITNNDLSRSLDYVIKNKR